VHFNADVSRADAEETARLVRESGAQAELVQADLASAAAATMILERTLARFGRLDVLINNVGIVIRKAFHEITDPEFDRIFAINAKAPFLLMRAAARYMEDGGRIVNVGTSMLACSFPFYSVYAGSKAPLEHFTRALAKEVAERRITVNTIAPGALDTPFFYGGETKESAAAMKQFTGGLGAVADVMPVVEFLVRPDARWVSGQTLFVNGAFVSR
jgi:NAD(P)-dependent dehydrogenase (short-subunit alcohol dehydrogenase family)